jgi:hypothetical protein
MIRNEPNQFTKEIPFIEIWFHTCIMVDVPLARLLSKKNLTATAVSNTGIAVIISFINYFAHGNYTPLQWFLSNTDLSN